MEVKVADLKKHKELKFVVDYMAKDMAKFRKSLTAKKGGKKKKNLKNPERKLKNPERSLENLEENPEREEN